MTLAQLRDNLSLPSMKWNRSIAPVWRITMNTLNPPLALLAKLGSIIVHAEEMIGPNAHEFDLAAFKQLLNDDDVQKWLEAMGPLVPVKRMRVSRTT